jgi:molecular chaperone IbpA
MTQLTRFDTNALNRSLLGFDRFFDDFENRFANQLNNNYPPYNVIKHSDDVYEVELAVSGFNTDEISVKVDQDTLIIEGQKQETQDSQKYLYKGLATRDFVRKFTLADHIEVKDCTIKNGILSVSLLRLVPEVLKPRVIEIKTV